MNGDDWPILAGNGERINFTLFDSDEFVKFDKFHEKVTTTY